MPSSLGSMNSRKRQASESLSPLRNPKQPRLALKGYDGGAPSPSQLDGVLARWKRLGYDATMLAVETAAVLVSKLTLKDRQATEPVAETPSLTLTPRETPPILSPMSNATLVLEQGESPSQNLFLPPKRAIDQKQRSIFHFPSVTNMIFGTKEPTSEALEPPNESVLPPRLAKRRPPQEVEQDHVTLMDINVSSIPTPPPEPEPEPHPSTSTPRHHGKDKTALTSILEQRIQTLDFSAPRRAIDSRKTDYPDTFKFSTSTTIPTDKSFSTTNAFDPSTSLNSAQLSFTTEPDSRLSSRKSSLSSHRKLPRRKALKSREHIHSKIHQANVVRQRKNMREEIARELYLLKRQSGFTSGYSDFKGLMDYQRKLLDIQLDRPSAPALATFGVPLKHKPSVADEEQGIVFLQNILDKAKATLNSPKPPKPFIPTFEQLQISQRAKDDAIERRLRPPVLPLPSSLPPEDEQAVNKLLQKRGVISKFEREQVSDQDIMRLRPGQWLNDEIINFYGAMILARSEASKENPGVTVNGVKGQKALLRVHYFSSFFWSKLTGDGYDKGRLAKWTKKIDLFSKDVILIPVNHRNAHWTAGAINFRKKRIESYDSMGMAKDVVFKHLRAYLDAEHSNKKKKPFDFTDWENWAPNETPQQENGFDCGVFTCQFLESLSRGQEAFNFSQKDMPYLRRRMIWEIGNAKLRHDH